MSATALRSLGQPGLRLLAVAAAVLASGCSSLTPQIFSDRVVTVPATSNNCSDASKPASLDCAYEEAAQVKGRYMVAVRDQGNAQPLLSAGLIGLSGLTLFKGITHPNTRDMVGAGVLGSTALAWGSTQLSTPRLAVYRAGADALMCAMTAVEPLRPGQATLGAITDGPTVDTLYGRRAAVVARRNELAGLLRQHAALNTTTDVTTPAMTTCKPATFSAAKCPAAKPGQSEEDTKIALAQCKLLPPVKSPPQCTTTPAKTVTIAPPQRVTKAFGDARDEINTATQLVDDVKETINAMRDAGPLLARKTQDIQLAVSAEVDKTVPNLSAVMAAAGSLRTNALALTGFAAFKPGAAQGDSAFSALAAEDRSAVSGIEKATSALNDARVALNELAALSVGTDRALVRQTLNECAFRMAGIKLVVTPSAESVTVPLGTTAVFFAFVSGASGIPTATATGPKEVQVKFSAEGGQFRFEFAPPQGSKAGDKYKLTFAATSGAGTDAAVVQQVVQIAIADAVAATPGAAPADPKAKTGDGTGTGAGTTPPDGGPAARVKFKDLSDDNVAALGLPKTASDDAIQKAVNNCQATAKPAIPTTGAFDAATRDALKAKTCSPAG